LPEPALGALLKKLREDRGLSLRELAQLADIDHAYIYRLETGVKEAPSEEALTKLSRALKAGKREGDMLRYVASHSETDAGLVLHALADASVTYEEFATAASASYRGHARPDYSKLIERVRRILSED
jgi:HTH-type transcriptional regulator, competence development regulator